MGFPADRSKPLILHVDDSATILIVTQGMLTKLGCDVITARDGMEGLALAEEKLPDLILLDNQMPGLDGYEVCARIRLNPKIKDIPILMVTAGTETAVVSGLDGYIHKPITLDLLKTKIGELIKWP